MDLNYYFDIVISFFLRILPSESFVVPLLAATLGATIAGVFSFKAIKKAHEYNLEKSDREEQRITENTLALLMIEIRTALELYNKEYAKDLKDIPKGKPYIVTFPVGTNTFTLYDSSPSCLANLPIEVAEIIVLIYMRMKGLIATIKINNSDVRQAHHAAENSMQIVLGGMAANGRQPNTESLDSTYQKYVNHEAIKLSMGATADAMKLLGDEIDALYVSLLKITSSNTPNSKPHNK